MLTTGFEEEILTLLKKWKFRKEQKDQWYGPKRVKVESSSLKGNLEGWSIPFILKV